MNWIEFLIKNSLVVLRHFVILFVFVISGCGGVAAIPPVIPSRTPSLDATPTTVATAPTPDSQDKLMLLGMTENLTTDTGFFGPYNNLIFSSTIDGQQPRFLELLEDRRVEYISSRGNGEIILVTNYQIIKSAGILPMESYLGRLYLHNTNLGWTRLLTERLWDQAFFLPDHQGIVYSILDENSEHVFYLVDEHGENHRELLRLSTIGVNLLHSYNSKYLFYTTEEKLSYGETKAHKIWRLSLEDGAVDEFSYCNTALYAVQDRFACVNFTNGMVSIFDLYRDLLLERVWENISMVDWSPDETRLLIETLHNENEKYIYQSFVWDIESDNITLLPVDGAMGNFSGRVLSAINNEFWSPDGSKVLIYYDDPVIVDVNTLEVFPVENPLQNVSLYGVYWLR
jgi:hypothetical protein